MAETVYGTEDSTMVMSEKVNDEKSIEGGGEGGKKSDSKEKGEEKSKNSKKIKLNNFYHMLLTCVCTTSSFDITLQSSFSLSISFGSLPP